MGNRFLEDPTLDTKDPATIEVKHSQPLVPGGGGTHPKRRVSGTATHAR